MSSKAQGKQAQPTQDKQKLQKISKTVVPKLTASQKYDYVKINNLRSAAFKELVNIIENINVERGKISLVLDPSIIGPLALIMPLSTLKVCKKVVTI